MAFGRKLAGEAVTAAAVHGFLVRPRLMRWGASDEEVAGPYPGADVVPDGARGPTMAVTIDAPPEQVWPWLVQMGGDRGGWYSWDRLDNAGCPSARRVHPEWQSLAVGDFVGYRTRRHWLVDAWRVAGRPHTSRHRGHEAIRPRWLGRISSYIPVVWIMQARTLAVLKRNIERAARPRRQTIAAGVTPGQAATRQEAGSGETQKAAGARSFAHGSS